MKNIGIIVDHLGPCQLSYQLIKSINEYLQSHDDVSPVLFYHNLTPTVVNPNFGICTLFEAYSFQGSLVATNLNNASRCLEFIGATQRYFYPADLEWTKIGQRNYEQLQHIYANAKMPIIARSEAYKQIFESTWNGNVVGIVEDFNFTKLMGVILAYEGKIN